MTNQLEESRINQDSECIESLFRASKDGDNYVTFIYSYVNGMNNTKFQEIGMTKRFSKIEIFKIRIILIVIDVTCIYIKRSRIHSIYRSRTTTLVVNTFNYIFEFSFCFFFHLSTRFTIKREFRNVTYTTSPVTTRFLFSTCDTCDTRRPVVARYTIVS